MSSGKNLIRNHFDALKNQTVEIINLAVRDLYIASNLISKEQYSEIKVYDLLVEPPQKEFGDFAFGLFILSKVLKKSPAVLAAEIGEQIKKQLGNDDFAKINILGPYVNFKYSNITFAKFIILPIINGQFFKEKLFLNPPKTMIEYSQPNTHKELHVGHMRNMCLGDALVKFSKYSGIPMITSTFPGDVGTHVAKCLWYLKFHNKETLPVENKGEWIGRIYSLANNKLEDELGTEKELQNRSQLTEILKQLETKTGEFFELWKETREWSILLMKQIYQWADIQFDFWYWESDVDSDSVKLIKKFYEQGKLIQSQGAIGLDLSNEDLGFCMLLKSDGTGLYATKDVELARRKFENHQIEKSIYVVDVRQALHFKQVFRALEVFGYPQAKDCFHLQYNFVELPDGAMSSRKGNIVPITKLIHEMENKIKNDYLNRYAQEWSQAEINNVASIVAKGAIKYGMLRQDPGKKIVFDMNEWLKLDGESGPFIQYSFARIKSLLNKAGWDSNLLMIEQLNQKENELNQVKDINWSAMAENAETELMQILIHFNQMVALSIENYKPSTLCSYLYDVAKRFNFFYHECSILNAESEELKKARLALTLSTGIILKKGLSLLGIPVPEKM